MEDGDEGGGEIGGVGSENWDFVEDKDNWKHVE